MQETLPSIAEREELRLFAEHLADRTRALILDLWLQRDIGTQLKDDKTPVTEVDLQAEQLARTLISERYPEHGIVGEEYDPVRPGSEYQWTIDPIDGTQNLVNKIPTFGTLIGLRFKERSLIGVIDHPALNLRCSGGSGIGVRLNGVQKHIEDLPGEGLSDNDLIVTNNIGVFGDTASGRDLFTSIMAAHPHSRIYYDCYAATLAISGSVAVVVEPNLKLWDFAPVEALITEAGGQFCFFNQQQKSSNTKLFNAIYGKPAAVRLMLQKLEGKILV